MAPSVTVSTVGASRSIATVAPVSSITAASSVSAVTSVSTVTTRSSVSTITSVTAVTAIASITTASSITTRSSVTTVAPVSAISTVTVRNRDRLTTMMTATGRTSRGRPVTAAATCPVVSTSMAWLNNRLRGRGASAIGTLVAVGAVDDTGRTFVPHIARPRVGNGARIGDRHESLNRRVGKSRGRSRCSPWESLEEDLGILPLVEIVDGPSLDRGTSTCSLRSIGWVTQLVAEGVVDFCDPVCDRPWREIKSVADTAVTAKANDVAV